MSVETAQRQERTRAESMRVLRAEMRRRRPGLRAIPFDAAAYCANRAEPWPASRLGRALTMLRLCWQADDFAALVLYRIRSAMLDAPFPVPILPKLLHLACIQMSAIRIGDWVVIGEGVYIPHGEIVLDGFSRIGRGATLCPSITIGLARGNVLGPTIGDNVFVGTGARMLGSVTVGSNASIGANAVVLRDVPEGATAVGVPARIIMRNGSE